MSKLVVLVSSGNLEVCGWPGQSRAVQGWQSSPPTQVRGQLSVAAARGFVTQLDWGWDAGQEGRRRETSDLAQIIVDVVQAGVESRESRERAREQGGASGPRLI